MREPAGSAASACRPAAPSCSTPSTSKAVIALVLTVSCPRRAVGWLNGRRSMTYCEAATFTDTSGPRTRSSLSSTGCTVATTKGSATTRAGVVVMSTVCEASRSKSSCSSAGTPGTIVTWLRLSRRMSRSTMPSGWPAAFTTVAARGSPFTSTVTAAFA